VAKVFLAAGLRRFAGGLAEVEIAAPDVRGLIDALDARFPGIGAALRSGTAIAIDGEIIGEPELEPIPPGAEVHFLPSISGGLAAAPKPLAPRDTRETSR
jgi:molybdopterin converting factor small subunit